MASRNHQGLVARKEHQVCSCYRCLPLILHCHRPAYTSHNSGGIAVVYRLISHDSSKDNFRRCNSIIRSPRLSNRGSVVTSKFWSSLYCCLDVKQTTIRCSSSTGLSTCYATSRCRYQLMHPGFQTRLLATGTQSSPPSPGPPGTTFELDCGYHLRVSCRDYVCQILFRRTFGVTCMDLTITM